MRHLDNIPNLNRSRSFMSKPRLRPTKYKDLGFQGPIYGCGMWTPINGKKKLMISSEFSHDINTAK